MDLEEIINEFNEQLNTLLAEITESWSIYRPTWRKNTITVTIPTIQIKDKYGDTYDYSDFTATLTFCKSSFDPDSFYTSISIEQEIEQDGYIHPHVYDNGSFCMGENAIEITEAADSLDIVGFIAALQGCLLNYNPDSQVRWLGMGLMDEDTSSCDSCGQTVHNDDIRISDCCETHLCEYCYCRCNTYRCHLVLCSNHTYRCETCDETFCEDHILSCTGCSNSFCERHMERCKECGDRFCPGCLEQCRDCENNVCNDCISSERRCRPCQNEHDDEMENEREQEEVSQQMELPF